MYGTRFDTVRGATGLLTLYLYNVWPCRSKGAIRVVIVGNQQKWDCDNLTWASSARA